MTPEDMLWDLITTAVAANDLPTIKRCISEGIDVNRKTANDKWNLLHMALLDVSTPPDVDPAVVKRLIVAGVDVNSEDSEGWTPLHFAARTGSVEAVQMLLDAGAKVNVHNKRGMTPLHRAIADHIARPAVIEALLAAGGDPDFTMGKVCARNLLNALDEEDEEVNYVRRLLDKYAKKKKKK